MHIAFPLIELRTLIIDFSCSGCRPSWYTIEETVIYGAYTLEVVLENRYKSECFLKTECRNLSQPLKRMIQGEKKTIIYSKSSCNSKILITEKLEEDEPVKTEQTNNKLPKQNCKFILLLIFFCLENLLLCYVWFILDIRKRKQRF